MIKQIERFSPHQNAKVIAILMALASLVFMLPFLLFASVVAPRGIGMPLSMMVLFPVIYLVLGYLGVASCWIYNAMFKHIGGIEYEEGPSAPDR